MITAYYKNRIIKCKHLKMLQFYVETLIWEVDVERVLWELYCCPLTNYLKNQNDIK